MKTLDQLETLAVAGTLRFVDKVNVPVREHCEGRAMKGLISLFCELQPSDRVRLALRKYENDFDRLLVALCIAQREGLKRTKRFRYFRFRGETIRIPFNICVAKAEASLLLKGITSLFNEEEMLEMETPILETE
jgi:hypothetical protein